MNDFDFNGFDPYRGMSEEERLKAGCIQSVSVLLGVLAALVLCALFGCAGTRYVRVPELHEVHHHHTDSIHETDSVIREHTTTIMQLDSAAMAAYGIKLSQAERAWLVRTQELERALQRMAKTVTDTVRVRDSVPVPYPIEKPVPAELTWWQRTRIHIANILLGVLAVAGVGWLAIRRFR